MSAEIVNVEGGVLVVRVAGKMTHTELAALQTATADHLQRQRLAILVLADAFDGWQRGNSDWGDGTFQAENDARIAKMAIVGDPKWKDLALMFAAQGMRPFPVEYFEDETAARAWLAAR